MDEDDGNYSSIGLILLFSLISVFILFISILFFAVLNNYVIGDLYTITQQYALSGIIPPSFFNIADTIVSSIPEILPVIDYFWFGSFITMIISSLIYNYNLKRQSYFGIFAFLVLGLLIYVYVGTYFNQVVDWFITEIYYAVLPDIGTYTPFFNWYLERFAIINIILVVVNVIANFVDLDFSKFFNSKDGDKIDEI